MKAHKFFLAVALIALIGACAHHPRTGSGALVGTWKNSLGAVWTISADGTFEVDLTRDNNRDAWGRWRVDGETVTLIRAGGMAPKNCRGKGVYRFTLKDEDTLLFTLVKDECKVRVKNVTAGWKRK
jgi:hypothetical protein